MHDDDPAVGECCVPGQESEKLGFELERVLPLLAPDRRYGIRTRTDVTPRCYARRRAERSMVASARRVRRRPHARKQSSSVRCGRA